MSSKGVLVGEFISKVDSSGWQHLLSRVSSEFQFLDEDWFLSWEFNYLPFEFPKSHVKYLSVIDINNKLQGVYPCMLITKFGLRILSAAGFYYPFRIFLHSKELIASCANAFVDAVQYKTRENIIRIGPAEMNQPINHILKSKFQDYNWMCHEINRGTQQILTLPGSVNDFERSLSKSLQKNIKRKLRKLRELGVVTIEKFNNCPSRKWAQLIEDCSDIEGKSWLFNDANGKLRIKGKEAFWKKYLENNNAQRHVNIWLVKLNGYPISYTFAIDSGPCRYSISCHYNVQFKKYGVGLMADYEMLQDSIHMGIKTVNFGDGEAEYKDRWGAKPGSQLVDYIYFRPSMLGYLFHSALKVRETIRSIHWQHRF